MYISVYVQYFFGSVKNETLNKKFILELIKRNQKNKKKICHVTIIQILTNQKYFPKGINQ